ncbi:hypothetical protein [Nitrospira sp. Ecomares 2.1]
MKFGIYPISRWQETPKRFLREQGFSTYQDIPHAISPATSWLFEY